jgi:hypothetical protein
MGFSPVNNPALVAIVTINGTTGDAGMGASAAGPVWVKVMDEALRLYHVPKDLPETPVVPPAQSAPEENTEIAQIDGDPGPNILQDDPSAMPSLADVPASEEGAELVPKSGVIPVVTAQNAPAGAVPVPVYTGPVAPDFRGKAMRVVVREAYALGFPIQPEGSGVARSQIPAPGSPVHAGEQIRVMFAR